MNFAHGLPRRLAAALLFTLTTPVLAGPDEAARLQAYVGAWTGTGTIEGGESPSPIKCMLGVRKGNGGKINFSGQCSALSAAGTIAYVDAAAHYEAVLTSNVDFAGIAVGVAKGGNLVFALKDRKADKKGNDLALNAQMLLKTAAIDIVFKAVLNGTTYSGTVRFTH